MTLQCVRVDANGTVTDLTLPDDPVAAIEDLGKQVGGDIEFAHYGRADGMAVCAIVHETSLVDGLPVNRAATEIAEMARGDDLSYHLNGTAVLTGWDPVAGELVDLPELVRIVLGGCPVTAAQIADVLDKAADVIDRVGLRKGTLWDREQEQRGTPRHLCCQCGMGAIATAICGDPSVNAMVESETLLWSAAVSAVEAAATYGHLADWSDSPERTAADVAAAFRQTARQLGW